MAAAWSPLTFPPIGSSRLACNYSLNNSSRLRFPIDLPPKQTSAASNLSGFTSSLFLRRGRVFFAPRPLVVASSGAMARDAGATVLILAGSYAFVSAMDSLARSNIIQQNLSRKIVHILSGLLYMASWPLFSTSTEARYIAAIVPLTNCLRLLIYGLSLASDQELIKSVTREGNPKELLRGPLYYVLILTICALVFWRDSPVGMISLAMMCGGDGIADIVGRRFGSLRLPYNKHKSWAGSISMFAFGFMVSLGMLYYFSWWGYIELNWESTIYRVALISLVATIVESNPYSNIVDDNISVPLTCMVTASLLF